MSKSKKLIDVQYPRYMSARKLSKGKTAFYWQLPGWAKAQGCSLVSEALGQKLGPAITRAEYLNQLLDDWRADRKDTNVRQGKEGTVDWLADQYLRSPQFRDLKKGSQQNYEIGLRHVCNHIIKDGSRFGSKKISKIEPGVADRLHERLRRQIVGDMKNISGEERPRAAKGAIVAIRRAWNVVYRGYPNIVPEKNPFSGVNMSYKQTLTYKASHQQLEQFVEAAQKLEMPSMAVAAMASFYWLMRPEHVREILSWEHYTAGERVSVHHDKTDVIIDLPLCDEDGQRLYPELEDAIKNLPCRGDLMISYDRYYSKPVGDRYMPYKPRKFADDFAIVREAAGLSEELTPETFRHGGMTDAGTVGGSDQEIVATSGHKSRNSVDPYVDRTDKQKRALGKKRLLARRSG